MKFATVSKINLHFYSFLSRFRHPKSYKGKIMLVVAAHVPLLSLLIYFVISSSFTFEMKVSVIVIAFLATLIGTAITPTHYIISLHP